MQSGPGVQDISKKKKKCHDSTLYVLSQSSATKSLDICTFELNIF